MTPATAVRKDAELAGWRFVSVNDGAMSSDDRAAFASALRLGASVPLPEMVFAHSSLVIERLSQNFVIRFDVVSALEQWADAKAQHWDHTNYDFTYSSDYCGSVHRTSATEHGAISVVETSESLPLEKLLQRVEIMYYDRVLLFEDDVRDLGEIFLEVKTRAMDFGFLVLCRYYCRIDGKTVRLVDTRYYHEFGQDFVWRDQEHREATIAELRQSQPYDPMHQLDLSADAIYISLKPAHVKTEKIFL
ncbi:hypothetical protein Poli38472_002369 [Pythium oligandrum]|uniref:TIP41-like protein n=1 Tax=Pythium oligandrum TaxID=41045 RepID=A0A8K1CJ70_PYTOL|nr:hypothetical protein Poli38472_002369 [Pythium oligandrum]|eukprot:TMW63428.1 hypothetical protein Poli38472_002369 [Pythium oligandrum]